MRPLILAAILSLVATPALAQEQSNGQGNGTTVNSAGPAVQGNSQSASNVTVVADAGRYAPADTSIRQSGHVYSTPSVAGSFISGANPCLVGTGGGAAGGPIGFSLNIGKSDEGCNRRSDAAAWHALGFDNVAIARLCQDVKSADAFFSATGQACPGTAASGRYKLASGKPAPEMYIPAAALQAAPAR